MFSSKNIISLRLKKDMNILDDKGVSILSVNFCSPTIAYSLFCYTIKFLFLFSSYLCTFVVLC